MPCTAWQRRTEVWNQEKSRAHLRLTVFHFVQLCFAAEARVTGSLWAVDDNNIGPLFKDIVFFFRTLFSQFCVWVKTCCTSWCHWFCVGCWWKQYPQPPDNMFQPLWRILPRISRIHLTNGGVSRRDGVAVQKVAIWYFSSTSSFVFQIMLWF